MKNLYFILLVALTIFILSCTTEDEAAMVLCENDFVEFFYNDTMFRTMHLPEQGEILTPSMESCGVGAALNKTANILTLRILGESQNLFINADLDNVVGDGELLNVEYTDEQMNSPYNNLMIDPQNYFIVEENDTISNTMSGIFRFKIENVTGEVMNITNGTFNCSYHAF